MVRRPEDRVFLPWPNPKLSPTFDSPKWARLDVAGELTGDGSVNPLQPNQAAHTAYAYAYACLNSVLS